MDGLEVLLEPGWEFGVSSEFDEGCLLPTANILPLDWDLLLLQKYRDIELFGFISKKF